MNTKANEAPERIRLLKRDGRFANEWYYPDAAVMPFEREFHYARVDPPTDPHRCNGNPTPHHGTQNKCTICGEYRNGWFDPVSGLEILQPKVAERDAKLAQEIVARLNWMDFESLAPKELAATIITALAIVRQEVAKETWEKAINAVKAHQQSVRDRHFGVLTLVVEALESTKQER